MIQVCEKAHKEKLLGTMMMLGLLIGSLIGGVLCDQFGRKKTMFGSCILAIPFVMFAGYSPNYICYLIMKLICSSAVPCIWLACHSTTLEIFDPKNRLFGIIIQAVSGTTSQLALFLVVYFVRHWTYLHLAAGIMCLLSIPSFFIIPESPRYILFFQIYR